MSAASPGPTLAPPTIREVAASLGPQHRYPQHGCDWANGNPRTKFCGWPECSIRLHDTGSARRSGCGAPLPAYLDRAHGTPPAYPASDALSRKKALLATLSLESGSSICSSRSVCRVLIAYPLRHRQERQCEPFFACSSSTAQYAIHSSRSVCLQNAQAIDRSFWRRNGSASSGLPRLPILLFATFFASTVLILSAAYYHFSN